ncbi:hypothetical protein KSP39_PZI001598 [Platanthera zijinensis]|uniref:Uncharacterized protein n=1 Tax=Platanthera zijinensis TaxID=2320716 RepID=A0AAP0C2D7_9ASPA
MEKNGSWRSLIEKKSIHLRFLCVENELLNYLLTSPAERSHVKSRTGDRTSWKRLAKHLLYWARVERVLRMN